MFDYIGRVVEYLKVVGIGGAVNLLIARFSKKVKNYTLARENDKPSVMLRMPSSDVWVYKQIFIDEEYKFTTIKKPKIIIDAGANIGFASIYFSDLFPEAKIIALEPERNNFSLLKENVKDYKNIFPLEAALWSENKKIDLCDSGHGNWGFMTYDKNEDIKTREHEVNAITVDRIMEMFNLDSIDILKIDIEGAEKEVFTDTSKWIDQVDTLIVELHDRMKKGCSRNFYNNSPGFKYEWLRGENVFLSKGNIIE